MDDRLNGVWEPAAGDKELQQRFKALFGESEIHGDIHSLIGAQYLRENQDLLA